MKRKNGLMVALDFVNCPEVINVAGKKQNVRINVEWVPPMSGWLKFNVDGSAIGKPGLHRWCS